MSGREELNDLMTEFNELSYYMGYCPTTLCHDPDAEARDWKVRVMCAVDKIEREARNGIPDDERLKSREQQIVEMAATIIAAHVFDKEDYAMEAAKALYNAGYRKGAKK